MKPVRVFAALCLVTFCQPAAAVGDLVDVSVYDRTSRSVLPVYQQDGRWYVAGRPGNEYEVRVRNNTGSDVLAVISVDGVNAITGQTASVSQSGYVLRAWDSTHIAGWRKSMSRVARFYFTEHSDAYATRTDRPDDVGAIGVAVFKRMRSWEDEVERSPRTLRDQRLESDSHGGSAKAEGSRRHAPSAAQAPEPGIGTGHGRSETSRARHVEFQRASSVPDEVIVIHYDTRANLLAQGIIRPPVRNPNPFPARFVPDPPRN